MGFVGQWRSTKELGVVCRRRRTAMDDPPQHNEGGTYTMTTTELWTWEANEAVNNADLSGFDVEATDGHIGKVDEATYDAGASCLVVDTGFWIFGKKRLIPAGVVQRIDVNDEKVYISMTKDEVKSAPDYDEQQRDDQDQYDSYYEPFGR
jgi:hypothetical protein